MKKKLLSLIVASALGHSLHAQTVNIPDANFKAYLLGESSINGNGNAEIEVSEATNYYGGINCVSQGVADATGIEAFVNASVINFSNNQLTSIDLSANTQVVNLALGGNQLTSLDVSNNSSLTAIYCDNNDLTSLNVANGNNTAIGDWAFYANGNPNLTCIQVDDAAWSTANWTSHIDAGVSFDTDCSCTVDIPDANFKAYLIGNTAINTNSDTEIQCDEASAYTGSISVWGQSIADLAGIEAFTALTSLDCGGNNLTSLDVSANTALTYLGCSENSLTSLDLSANTALTDLYCNNNNLSSLTIGSPANLWLLQCSYNALTALDISGCPALVEFYCRNNQITSLDGSNNPLLNEFYCRENALTSLNVANGNNANIDLYAVNNPDLLCVEVDDAAWSTANMASAIDATAAYSEDCSNFCAVDIPDANFKSYLLGNASINTNGNGQIECTEAAAYSGTISVNTFSISDLSGIEAFTSITNLDCAGNSLTSLDLSANTALAILRCQANALTSLDLSANTALLDVVCHSNGLTSLTVGNLTSLEILSCGGNALTALDVTGCPALVDLHCGENQITALDVTNSPLITNLYVANNALTALDLSSNTSLQLLSCWNNQLTTLGVSNIPTLETIDCRLNSIVTLDFSNNPALVDIQARYNSLTSLNVANGNNTIITGFNLLDNPSLTCIEVDDAAYSTTNWIYIDGTASFSENCLTVGIDTQEEVEFNLCPNPANDVLNLQTDASISRISISDMAGRTVMAQSLNGATNAKLDVSSMESGVYLLTVTDINGITTSHRWIKK